MTEETQVTEEVQEVQETAEPSLEELASQFTPPEPQQRETVQTEPAFVPNPEEDPEGFARHQAEQTALILKQNQEIQSRIQADDEAKALAQQKADIQAAVDAISEGVEGAQPEMIEGLLHVKYDRDANFQKIWDNRHQNPQAFNKAMGVIAQEYRQKAAIKVDSQVAENERALNQSISNQSSARQPDPNDEWKGLNNNEFDRKWMQMSTTSS